MSLSLHCLFSAAGRDTIIFSLIVACREAYDGIQRGSVWSARTQIKLGLKQSIMGFVP